MTATPVPPAAAFLDVSRELLARGVHVRFRADGSSMYPTIRDTETITVASTEASAIRRGDIVLYRQGHGVIAHRVRRIESLPDGGRTFVLRGDAADSDDAPIGAEQILGKVLFVDRASRRVALAGRWARLRQAVRASASRLKCRATALLRGASPEHGDNS